MHEELGSCMVRHLQGHQSFSAGHQSPARLACTVLCQKNAMGTFWPMFYDHTTESSSSALILPLKMPWDSIVKVGQSSYYSGLYRCKETHIILHTANKSWPEQGSSLRWSLEPLAAVDCRHLGWPCFAFARRTEMVMWNPPTFAHQKVGGISSRHGS